MEPPGREAIAQHEWRQWRWIELWEERVKKAGTLKDALVADRQLPSVESGEMVQQVWLVVRDEPLGVAPTPLYVTRLSGNGQGGSSPSTPEHSTDEGKNAEVPH